LSTTESSTEPTPQQPVAAAEPPSGNNTHILSVNGVDETALARLADDGGPSAPPVAGEPESSAPASTPTLAPLGSAADTLSLEQRIRRLEDALTSLQEQRDPEPPLAAPPTASLVGARTATSPPTSTAVLLDVGKRLLGTATQAIASAPMAVPAAPPPSSPSSVLWLLWDTWAEARVIARMFVDPRYHLPWSARLLPLLLLAAILTSKYWVPGSSIPILGEWLLVKLVDLLLAFLLFKWLGHEARRYRHTSPDVPPSLRL
jgi:hypothetical protein